MVIIGSRECGKTHIAVVMAVETARLGGRVLFQGDSKPDDRMLFLRCLEHVELMFPEAIEKVYSAYGAWRILFKGGGCLCFFPKAFDYFAVIDLHVIDDADRGDPRPNALRSIKTVLM
jgi:hypothetical protein